MRYTQVPQYIKRGISNDVSFQAVNGIDFFAESQSKEKHPWIAVNVQYIKRSVCWTSTGRTGRAEFRRQNTGQVNTVTKWQEVSNILSLLMLYKATEIQFFSKSLCDIT